MATRNLVPRQNTEGKLGTNIKRWGEVNAVKVTATTLSGTLEFEPVGNLSSITVQEALAELDSKKETPAGAQDKVTTAKSEAVEAASIDATNKVNAHANAGTAHGATQVQFTATGTLSSTNVQSAIEELDAEKAAKSEIPTTLPASGGNADTAFKLAIGRKINGVPFDGTGDITITAAANGGNAATCSGNSATATKLATPRTINGVPFDGTQNITTNSGSADKLSTARTINGVPFDGTGDITITAAANGGNAATATKLAVARTIAGVAFDGSTNINIPYVNLTGLPTISSSGKQLFTASGTFTVPAGVTKVWVTMCGGGGGGSGGNYNDGSGRYGGAGGAGGCILHNEIAVTPGANISVTVGVGGTAGVSSGAGGAGGASSFGALRSISGGGGATFASETYGASGGFGAVGRINLFSVISPYTSVALSQLFTLLYSVTVSGYGYGGAGGWNTGQTAGAPGFVLVEW